jgi:serine/threonine protein kinase
MTNTVLIKTSDGGTFPRIRDIVTYPVLCETEHSKLYLTKYITIDGDEKECVAKVSKRQSVEDEFNITVGMKHPNILTPLAIYQKSVLFLPYCPGGSLMDLANNPLRPSERSCRTIFQQMLSAVEYIHECGIIHNDIKLENFLVEGTAIRLADFGLSDKHNNGELVQNYVGTPYYMAPEVLAKAGHTWSADIWSLGVSLYRLYYGCMPHQAVTLQELRSSVFHCDIGAMRVGSDELEDLIKSILRIAPRDRLTIKQIAEHAWLSGIIVMSARGHGEDIHGRGYHYRRSKSN